MIYFIPPNYFFSEKPENKNCFEMIGNSDIKTSFQVLEFRKIGVYTKDLNLVVSGYASESTLKTFGRLTVSYFVGQHKYLFMSKRELTRVCAIYSDKRDDANILKLLPAMPSEGGLYVYYGFGDIVDKRFVRLDFEDFAWVD